MHLKSVKWTVYIVITAHFEAKWMDSGLQNDLSTIAETSSTAETIDTITKNRIIYQYISLIFN